MGLWRVKISINFHVYIIQTQLNVEISRRMILYDSITPTHYKTSQLLNYGNVIYAIAAVYSRRYVYLKKTLLSGNDDIIIIGITITRAYRIASAQAWNASYNVRLTYQGLRWVSRLVFALPFSVCCVNLYLHLENIASSNWAECSVHYTLYLAELHIWHACSCERLYDGIIPSK